MAKIIKVDSQSSTSTPRIVNPFKTSRNSTTNPFNCSNFEGNTLQFADVFEGFESKKSNNISFKGANKLKMVAASVTGSMNKMRTGITESVINFANRVRNGIAAAYDYAMNTDVADVPAIKAVNDILNTPINLSAFNGISDSLSNIGKNISERMSWLNTEIDTTEIAKSVSESWNSMISKLSHKKINSECSVLELEQLWKNEIALMELGGAA